MDLATLQNSVFLQALGSAILSSLWQGFILWFIYETVNIFYKSATSGFKNKLSTLLMFVAFAWFIISFISGISIDEKILLTISFSANTDTILQPATVNNFTFQQLFSFAAVVLPYLSVSYIFLLMFLMGKLFSAYRHVYFIANKRLIEPPSQLQEFAATVAARMVIVKKISVWISDYIDVPATIGFIKPVILIPVASINNLSAHQLEAIILHELSHIKRNDYLINLFISVIETILFFNPFIFLLSKALKRERENCCDDFVIQYRYDPHSYASALLRLEQNRKSNTQLSIGAVSGKKQLLTRIKRITNNQATSKQFNYGQKLFALLVITGIICSVAWLSPQEKSNKKSNQASKNAEKVKGIIPYIKDRKKDLITIENDSVIHNMGKANLVKSQKSTIDVFNNADAESKFLIPDDSKMANPEWNDFEINNEKLVDDQISQKKKLFSINSIKLPPIKDFLNFTFPNPDLNNNVTELNNGLLKAYEEIKKMDWNKIGYDINKSLSNIDINQLLKMQRKELTKEKMKSAEILKKLKSQTTNSESFFSADGKTFFLRDSLSIAAPAYPNETYTNVQGRSHVENLKISRQPTDYEYAYVPAPGSDAGFVPPQIPSSAKAVTVTGFNNKNIKIIIERFTQSFSDGKNSFNFTSSSSQDKKAIHSTRHKIIRIEVNELP